MDIQINEHGRELSVIVSGELNKSNSTGLAERLSRMCANHSFESLTIDLGNCPTIGSLGIGGLIGFRLSPMAASKKARIVNANNETKKHLFELSLDRLFEIT